VSVEAPFEVLEEGLAARIDFGRPAVVRGYVSALDGHAARAAVADVERSLGHLQAFSLRPIGELQTRVIHEEDWAEAWKEHFPVLRVGRRMVIQPTWREHEAGDDEVVISLDPGMAFGTGLHPTTRLCLAGLESWADDGVIEGARVLDVGCGSGILAIGAGLLGASEVLAVDTDPLAVETTSANARLNSLSSTIRTRQGSVPGDGDTFDLVLANLVASLLVQLAPDLARVLDRPVGRLLASGIFHDREAEVVEALESAGLRVTARTVESEWVCLEARP
jgi:ribosomal protein L11 methyltransferase